MNKFEEYMLMNKYHMKESIAFQSNNLFKAWYEYEINSMSKVELLDLISKVIDKNTTAEGAGQDAHKDTSRREG